MVDFINRTSRMPHKVIRRMLRNLSKPIYKMLEEDSTENVSLITHITYYKVGNLGDTVLSQCVRQCFKKFVDYNIGFRLFEVNTPITDTVIQSINQTKILCIGGGGLFLPDTNENSISGWQWAISKKQLDSIKSPIILFAIGYNYFPGQINSDLFIENVTNIIGKANFVGLRNHGSVTAISKLLPSDLSNKVCYQPCPTTLIRRLYSEIPTKVKTKRIGFNMAFDRSDRRFGDQYYHILRSVAKAAKEIQESGYQIVYICHCPEDRRFLKYLRGAKVDYELCDMSDWVPIKAFKFYNEIELMIGMRGHAQMIPFGLNCKIISLGTHDKMRWFLEDIEAVDWYVDLRSDPNKINDRITSIFNKIMTDEKDSEQRLLSAQSRLFEVTMRNMNNILNLLKENN